MVCEQIMFVGFGECGVVGFSSPGSLTYLLSDEEILERLLALNLERAKGRE